MNKTSQNAKGLDNFVKCSMGCSYIYILDEYLLVYAFTFAQSTQKRSMVCDFIMVNNHGQLRTTINDLKLIPQKYNR